jgi:uncharacterized protein (DUF362 family)
VDAIIAGEGNGPLVPDPLSMNCYNKRNKSGCIDAVAAHLMGFDPLKIRQLETHSQYKKFQTL